VVGSAKRGWNLSGSATEMIRAMRLNSKEGCEEDLNEHTRRHYNFSREQLKGCRRRIFWTAFLVEVSSLEKNSTELIMTSTSDFRVSLRVSSVPYS
jgi:hypothetical protein